MTTTPIEAATGEVRRVLWRWTLVLGVAAAALIVGPPDGITPQGWRLLAIFLATIVASIVRPAPMGAVVVERRLCHLARHLDDLDHLGARVVETTWMVVSMRKARGAHLIRPRGGECE